MKTPDKIMTGHVWKKEKWTKHIQQKIFRPRSIRNCISEQLTNMTERGVENTQVCPN